MAVDKNMNVLVVDDYKTMLNIIQMLLKQIGFSRIDEAADGVAALDMTKEKNYGLIISDWNMEPMTGLDFLKAVRGANNDNQDTPFIMVTAENKTEKVIAAKQAGVNNYIVKPFDAETLKQKIVSVLGDF